MEAIASEDVTNIYDLLVKLSSNTNPSFFHKVVNNVRVMGNVSKYHINYQNNTEMQRDVAMLLEAIKENFEKKLHSKLLQKIFINIEMNKFLAELESAALNQSSQ
jgi:isopenicillin N synthase-like dioxygenase